MIWVGRGILRIGEIEVDNGEAIPSGVVAPGRLDELKKRGLVKDDPATPASPKASKSPKAPTAPKVAASPAAGPKSDGDF